MCVYVCMCVCVCVRTYHSAQVEVKGQLGGSCSPSIMCEVQGNELGLLGLEASVFIQGAISLGGD